jgi:AraC-like DNA-binding protein
MLVSAAPCALIWPAALILWGPGHNSSRHRHHGVQLVMALRGSLKIHDGRDRKWIRCRAALVRPDAPHEVEAAKVHILLAFVDAESNLGAGLLERVRADIAPLDDHLVAEWRRELGRVSALKSARVESWVRRGLLNGRRAPRIHPRVRRVLLVIREELGAGHDFSLKRLAAIAGLSQSRFMHVFTESVGAPLRPYILWLRVQNACGHMMRGATVTAAAHRSGFADTAHLTRTIRRMLGTTPGELLQRRSAVRAAFVSSDPTRT